MILSAKEVNQSFRGAIDLLNRRVEGLQSFDLSETGFWHSFAAVLLTLPAYIVSLAVERLRLGIPLSGGLLDNLGLDLTVAAAHVAAFAALPLAMIFVTRRTPYAAACVPFVIVTNWINVGGLLLLSVPAILLLLDLATPALAAAFTLAFAVILVRVEWFATKVTLSVSGPIAAVVVSLGLLLNAAVTGLLHAVL
jgi:hypothetical protein